MADPGGQTVGRVSVKVLPDTSDFLPEARKKLKALAEALKVDAEVGADVSQLREEITRAKREAERTKVKLNTELDTDGITRGVRRLRQVAQKATRSIKLTAELDMKKSLAKIIAQTKIITKAVSGYSIRIPVDFVGLTRLLGLFGLLSGAALASQHAVLALGGALKTVGGLAATLPAVFAAAGASVAVLAVGTRGFFDALSNWGDAAAFEQSLAKLSPSAASAARSLRQFREPLIEIRKATQQALFEGMAQSFSKLGVLLPAVRSGFVGIASQMREMGKAWIDMATSQQSVRDLDTILQNTAKGFRQAGPAAANLGQALRDIAAVGSSFLPNMGRALADVTKRFADFISEARQTGDLAQWIRGAVSDMKQLGRIASNVWKAFSNIATAFRGGESLLDMLTRITDKLREMTETKGAQQTFSNLARVMREVLDAATRVASQLFDSFGSVLKELTPFLVEFAQALATGVVTALKAVTPLLQSMAKWLSQNKAIMAPLLVTLAGIVTGFKLFSTAAKGILVVKNALVAMRAASVLLGTAFVKSGALIKSFVATSWQLVTVTLPNFLRMVATMIAEGTVLAARATAQAARVAAAWISNMVRTAAVATANATRMAAVAVASFVRMAASAVANAAKTTAAWVASWVRMAAVSLAQAARMAAAWVIAMGPVGWVTAAVIGLVALIIANWDKVKNFTRSAWNAVSNFVRNAWNRITSAVGGAIGRVRSTVAGGFNNVVNFVRGIPGRIVGALGDLGGLLVGAGRSLIRGFIGGIQDMIGSAVNAARNLVSSVRDFFPFSPAKRGPFSGKGYTIHSGRALAEDWAKGIRDRSDLGVKAVEDMMDVSNKAASAEWNGHITSDGFGGVASAVFDGVMSAFNGSRLQVDGNGMAQLVNKTNARNKRR